MNKLTLALGIILFIASALLASWGIYYIVSVSSMPDLTKKVEMNCYDRYEHKINGLSCEKIVIADDEVDRLLGYATCGIFLGMILLVVSLQLIIGSLRE